MSLSDELIIVPGHAAFKASLKEAPANPRESQWWVLQSFQQGEAPFYVEHIRQGVELWRNSANGVLMFSGGRTRREAGQWSEARSYAAVAQKLFGVMENDTQVLLEEYARDSFENVYFSREYFFRCMRRFPTHITVVGWEFKRSRFELHAETLGLGPDQFTYVGCNNPDDLAGAELPEARTLQAFKDDPWGKGPTLQTKRDERNPFNETPPY